MTEAIDDMYNVGDIETGLVVRDETEEEHDQDEDENSEAGSTVTGTAAQR
jgi:Ran GTPase-activating protein (RanGAP) involved in mRNA processing and transport